MRSILYFIFLFSPFAVTAQIEQDSVNYIEEVRIAPRLIVRGGRTWFQEMGQSYNRYVKAEGWFDTERQDRIAIVSELYNMHVIDDLTYLVKYRNGKLYSGKVHLKQDNMEMTASCKKGKLHGDLKLFVDGREELQVYFEDGMATNR